MYTQGCSFGIMRCLGGIVVKLTSFSWKVMDSIPSVDHFIYHMHVKDIYQINGVVLSLEPM